MTTNLVIVESPAKAKTIKKYLGADYTILASYGHIRDLRPKSGAVLPDENFAMKYELIKKNEKHISAIVSAMKKADALFLATDPDREGEAISWHIYSILKEKRALGKKPVHRIVFNEITKTAISQAIVAPREIAMELVNAQQARRALDYLVGFNLSPLLWKKIRYGLSAGRVQSPALRMLVERENSIDAFESKEYWSLSADLIAKQKSFSAKLNIYQNEKLEQFSITHEDQAEAIKADLIKQSKKQLTVMKIEKKQKKRNPTAPFITSTLQQEAARKLGFAVQRTMRIAQQLYEGIELENGLIGLITYMRTDSVHIANESIQEIRELILRRYGKEALPDDIRIYKTKAKNAQEAHEAIRPTSVLRTPESVKSCLSADQLKLYDLIWKRTIASQMTSANIDTIAIDLAAGEKNQFRATGSTVVDPGYMRVYQEGVDDKPDELANENLLPPLIIGDTIDLNEIHCHQHFTEPPPRYSEATLIKTLEEHGIGRPSTYASIVSTLQTRNYATLDNKRFKPTDIGRIVSKFLTEYFTQYVDYDFTAKLEDELDAISRGEKEWIPLLKSFWDPFKHQIETINTTVKRADITQETLDETCPECGKALTIRLGKKDRFIGCSAYPECSYTRAMSDDQDDTAASSELVEGRQCPDCGGDLKIKHGKFGKFIGCSHYPKCKHIESLNKSTATGVECPECHQGQIVKRQSRRGRVFYSCARYPDCKYAIWNEPTASPCPNCAWPILTIKHTKRRGTEHICPQQNCSYTVQAEPPEKNSKKSD